MQSRGLVLAVAFGAVSIAAGLACGTSDGPGASAPLADGGVNRVEASTYDGPTYGPPTLFTLVDEPDTGCVATTTAPALPVYPAGTMLSLFDLQVAGSRRVATGAFGHGFVAFDADGSNASASPFAPESEGRAAASSTNVLTAGYDGGNVVARRFDLSGQPLGAAEVLGAGRRPARVAVARSGEAGIVVWPSADSLTVRARLFDDAGKSEGEVVLETGAAFSDFSAVALPSQVGDGSKWLVVWALERELLGAHRVYAALVNGKGMLGLPKIVLASDARVEIAGAVATPSGALLLVGLDGMPVLAPLDPIGQLAGPAHRLVGAGTDQLARTRGLARNGNEAVVIGWHESGPHALRRVDLTGKPLEGWVCLDALGPNDFHVASIAADGAGYAAVMAKPEDATVLVRLDATGKGPLP